MLSIEETKRIQQIQYAILKEVKRICNRYNIQYFLCCGTLLGAIRHQGPIPWDDDLDIGFLRIDYDKFIQIAQAELSSNYFLQTWDTDPGYALPHCKIRDKRSHYIETVSKKSNCCDGISVDILPFDGVPHNITVRYAHCYILFDILNLIKIKRGWTFIKESSVSSMRKFVYGLLKHFITEVTLIRLYEGIQKKFSNSELVSETAGLDYFRFVGKREYYEEVINYKYLDDVFSIPKHYHELLLYSYSNYMQLPPVEKRVGQPGVEKVEYLD